MKRILTLILLASIVSGCATFRPADFTADSGKRQPVRAMLRFGATSPVPQQLIYCNVQTLASCNTLVNPGNGSQGDPAFIAFGKVNANFTLLFNMFGLTSNLATVGGANASDIINLWSGTPSSSLCLGSLGALLACSGGGSMTWPSGAAGIPNYAGSSAWGTSYSSLNPIPANFLPTALANGTTATTQTTGDNTTKLATDAFVIANAASAGVSSLAAGSGIAVSGSTGAVTVSASQPYRTVTGTSDTVSCTTDANGAIKYNNSGSIAVTVPQATGSCGAGFGFTVQDFGAGTVSLTATISTVNGSSSPFAVASGRGCSFVSDGTNYQVFACTALVSGSGGTTENVQVFTASGTWTKPSGSPQLTDALCLGAGGGGGSGAFVAASTAASGGGGGGGGAFVQNSFPTSSLSSTVTVTIGGVGTGGAAVSSLGAGNAGTVGGNATFGTLLTAYGGGAGSGGQSAALSNGGGGGGLGGAGVVGVTAGRICAGAGGGGGNGNVPTCAGAGAGGAGGTAAGASGIGASAFLGGSGGGSGAGLSASDVTATGGSSGNTAAAVGVAGGTAGNPGSAGNVPSGGAYSSGSGGGGGGSSASAAGGAGGVGALDSGGGGGGASDTTSSGAGANGGGGECVVVTTY